jgi:hypothetical protein
MKFSMPFAQIAQFIELTRLYEVQFAKIWHLMANAPVSQFIELTSIRHFLQPRFLNSRVDSAK